MSKIVLSLNGLSGRKIVVNRQMYSLKKEMKLVFFYY